MNLPALPIQEWELWNYYIILWWTCLPCQYKNENYEITTLFSDEPACPAHTRMRTLKLLHYSLMNLPALPIQKWELWNYYIILWWTCLPCQYKNENYEITTLFSDELACPVNTRMRTMQLLHYSMMNLPALPIQEWELCNYYITLMNLPALPIQEWKLWNYYIILWWTCLPCLYKNENFEITTLFSDEHAWHPHTRKLPINTNNYFISGKRNILSGTMLVF